MALIKGILLSQARKCLYIPRIFFYELNHGEIVLARCILLLLFNNCLVLPIPIYDKKNGRNRCFHLLPRDRDLP